MTDQTNCRCAPSPARNSTALTATSRCPVCGLVRESRVVSPPPPAPEETLEFTWSPAAASAPGTELPQIAVPTGKAPYNNSSGKTSSGTRGPALALELEPRSQSPGVNLSGRALHSRFLQHKVCRFLGAAIILWSLFSLLPGSLAWRQWLVDYSATSLPLWLPANLVLGGLPILLGILLLQVAESATLQAVAGGLLAICSAYGFAASLFALAAPDSNLLSALSFPYSETKRATVWCLAMATLAGLLSFSCFREGQRWQRIGELLSHLLPASERRPRTSG